MGGGGGVAGETQSVQRARHAERGLINNVTENAETGPPFPAASQRTIFTCVYLENEKIHIGCEIDQTRF